MQSFPVLGHQAHVAGAAHALFDLTLLPAFAALLSGAYQPTPQERIGVLVCGANLDPSLLAQDAS